MVTLRERRRSPRQLAQYPIRFYYTDNIQEPVHTLNLSTQGACIESPKLLPLGASIKFFLITPTNHVVDVVGRVVYVNPANNLPYRVGIRFTQLSNMHRQILANELQRN